jgi:sulfur carrier protein ThiS
MQVHVRLYGTLRRFSAKGTPGIWEGELPAGATLLDLIRHLGSSEGEVAAAALDGKPAPLDSPIPDGAEVVLVTPMGGGSTCPPTTTTRPQ